MSRSARIASALALSPASSLAGKPAPHAFPNGDAYTGAWAKGLPEGEGVYTWADGSTYEGAWEARRPRAASARAPGPRPGCRPRPTRRARAQAGKKHGLGTYTWPNGATYSGEWQAGCMHGVGTFEGPDGTAYQARPRSRPAAPARAPSPRPGLSRAAAQGGWAADLKQGLGRKVYANGDVYSGLWVAGKCDGPGRYRWRNGNEYNGEWRAGCMHGQGTLRWHTGARPAARRPPPPCGRLSTRSAQRLRGPALALPACAARSRRLRAPLPVGAEWQAPADARGRPRRRAGRPQARARRRPLRRRVCGWRGGGRRHLHLGRRLHIRVVLARRPAARPGRVPAAAAARGPPRARAAGAPRLPAAGRGGCALRCARGRRGREAAPCF